MKNEVKSDIKVKILVLIENYDGDILIIKEKTKKNSDYKWNLIRGTYDIAGEKLEETVRREVYEEVGIKCINDLKLLDQSNIYSNGKTRFYFIFSANTMETPVLGKRNFDESIIDYKWISKRELKSMKHDKLVDSTVYSIIQGL